MMYRSGSSRLQGVEALSPVPQAVKGKSNAPRVRHLSHNPEPDP